MNYQLTNLIEIAREEGYEAALHLKSANTNPYTDQTAFADSFTDEELGELRKAWCLGFRWGLADISP